MSVELLRRAAAGLRNDATEIPDRTVVDNRVNGVWLNSAYYLTTTPDFALAVADWLDQTAAAFDEIPLAGPEHEAAFPAFAVARLYLREAADDRAA